MNVMGICEGTLHHLLLIDYLKIRFSLGNISSLENYVFKLSSRYREM